MSNPDRSAVLKAITSMCHDMDDKRIILTARQGGGNALSQLVDAIVAAVAPAEAAAMAATVPTDAELTAIYERANGLAKGKAQPITTQRIFAAMRAMLDYKGPVAGQPAEPSPASYSSAERIMKLQEDCDALRTALEVIALGDAEDPVRDAGDTLVDLGHWRADALAQHRAEVAAPKGDSNG